MSFMIEITHVPTGGSPLVFEPYINSFSDNYKSEWQTSPTLGRMDNIATFIRTGRIISLDFTVVSNSLKEACVNYEKSKKLSNYLYPVYKTIKSSKQEKSPVPPSTQNNITSPATANVRNNSNSGTLEERLSLRPGVSIVSAPPILKIKFSNLITEKYGEGLYGYIDGFNFAPDTNAGYFLDKDKNLIIPKVYKVSLTFNVIHVHPRGWKTNNTLR